MHAFKKSREKTALRLAVIASSVLAATPALSAQNPDGKEGIDEVLVTAQRRTEKLENVPMSIVAVSQDALTDAGITSMHDLEQIAPGVRIEFTGAFTQPSIRGVTTLTTGSGFENNVAVYIDGFYSPDTNSINMEFSNLESVQILKGPQGTLYGRNATGGAIVINTAAPSKTLTGNASISYGSYNEVNASAYIAGPLSDAARASLSGSSRESDGYYEYIDPNGSGHRSGDAAPISQWSVRGKLELDLTENLVATLGYNQGLTDDPRGLIFTNQGYAPSYFPQPPFAARKPFTASTNVNTSNETQLQEGTAKLLWDTDFGSVTSYTGYATRDSDYLYDFDATYQPILESNGLTNQETFQQTVDVAFDTIANLDLIIGANYIDDRNSIDGSKNFLFGAPLDVNFSNLETDAWAIYADGTYHLSDRLALTLGGRYAHEEKHIDYRQLDALTQTINFVPPASADETFTAFTPRVSLRYEITPDTNVYGSISRGFRSGGFQPTPVPDPALLEAFDPEKITAYEIGLKTVGQSYRFETAAFYYDYEDLQVGITKANPVNNSLINVVSNAPKAEIYGLDMSGTIEVLTGLTLQAGVSLLHARYTDFKDVSAVGLDAAAGLNVDQIQDWSDLRMARAADVSGNIGATYETELAGGTLELASNVSFTSEYPQSNPGLYGPLAGSRANDQRYTNDGYQLVNAHISWTTPDEHVTLTVFGTNLTDERYYINYGGTTFGGDVGVFNQPRSGGVRAAYKY